MGGAAAVGAGKVPKLKPIFLPSAKKITIMMGHILPRHAAGGPLSAGRTVFPSTMGTKAIEHAIKDAYMGAQKVGVQGTDRLVLQGQGAGLKIEMWFNKVTSTIETAYPITR